MGELEDRINGILSDPKQMEMITNLASQFMSGGSAPETPKDAETGAFPGGDMLKKLGGLLGGGQSGGKDKMQLLHAMQPYLQTRRREKLEKAIKIARLAKLAGLAFEEHGGGENGSL